MSPSAPVGNGELSLGPIYESMVKFFHEDGWPIQQIDDGPALSMTCKGKNGQWICIAQAVENEGLFLFYSVGPMDVPIEKRPMVADLFTRANYGMLSGAFELSFDDGDIRFRTSARLGSIRDAISPRTDLIMALIQDMVYINVQMMDQYLPALYGVVYHDIPPAQAVAQVES